MIFKVKKGLPVPVQRQRNRYPLRDLAVGDHFLIPKHLVPRGQLHGMGRPLNIKLSCRKQDDGSLLVQRVG